MNVHVSYKINKTPDVEKEISQHIEKLRKRLQVFRPELVHLKGVVEENSPREGFLISLNLRLPSGQMAAQARAQSATAAVKAAFDDLRQQLTKHKDLLRNQHRWPRWRRVEEARPEPQVPFEETLAAVHPETISSDDISSYVNTNLPRLARFVERELRYRENADQIAPDSISVEEVIDETIANALGDGVEKPEKLALEPWLYQLARRAMDDVATRGTSGEEGVPLQRNARARNVRGSDEPLLQYHQPDEQLVEQDVIPDPSVATPEAIAASDEMLTLVEAALLGASAEDREAFLLYAVEGFTLEEITAITGHKAEDVRQGVRRAREHLRKSIPVPNQFRDKLLQETKSA